MYTYYHMYTAFVLAGLCTAWLESLQWKDVCILQREHFYKEDAAQVLLLWKDVGVYRRGLTVLYKIHDVRYKPHDPLQFGSSQEHLTTTEKLGNQFRRIQTCHQFVGQMSTPITCAHCYKMFKITSRFNPVLQNHATTKITTQVSPTKEGMMLMHNIIF